MSSSWLHSPFGVKGCPIIFLVCLSFKHIPISNSQNLFKNGNTSINVAVNGQLQFLAALPCYKIEMECKVTMIWKVPL